MRNFLIWGFSKSGRASLKVLYNKLDKFFLFDADNDVQAKLVAEFRAFKNIFILKSLNKDVIDGMNKIIISPSISIYDDLIKHAKRQKIDVLSELELGFLKNKNKKKIIAVTGTNGKTTTTQLIYNFLKEKNKSVRTCGNIGTPICEAIKGKEKTLVCEVSSFQLEGVKNFAPHISVLLNVSPDHLNRHKTFLNYKKTKYKIFKNAKKGDVIVISSELSKPKKDCEIYEFGFRKVKKGCYVENGFIVFVKNNKKEQMCHLSQINVIGRHNVENIMAGIIVAKLFGVKNKKIVNVIQNFKLDKHRIELCYKKDDKFFYDDSKATNLKSSLVAVQSLENFQEILLILGGSDKGYDFKDFFALLPKNVKTIYAVGEVRNKIAEDAKFVLNDFTLEEKNINGKKFENKNECENKNKFDNEKDNLKKKDDCESCKKTTQQIEIKVFEHLKEATLDALKNIKSGQALLLSPACASFDEFKNYCERGEKFVEYIKNYYEK